MTNRMGTDVVAGPDAPAHSTCRRRFLKGIGSFAAGLAASSVMRATAEASARVSRSGIWSTDHGQLRLHSFGDYVIGDYADRGIIVGAHYAVNRTSRIHGVFTNGPRAGVFDFRMTATRFVGDWHFVDGSGRGEWSGSLASPGMPDAMHNFTRSGQPSMITRNTRSELDGRFASPFGTIDLIHRDLMMAGSYSDVGVIAAQWVGNAYEGVFTNTDRVGWVRWPFSSRLMDPIEQDRQRSQWGWYGQGTSGSWPLTRTTRGPIHTPKWLTPPPTFSN